MINNFEEDIVILKIKYDCCTRNGKTIYFSTDDIHKACRLFDYGAVTQISLDGKYYLEVKAEFDVEKVMQNMIEGI